MSTLDPDIHYYFERGLANSTHRAYRAGVNRYISFCCLYNVLNPFPVSESMLCYFVVALAREGLAPSTIKTYLAAVRHTQIERGLPDLREGSSLPRLHMVQNGIRRQRAEQGPPPAQRLPITPAILNQIRGVLLHEPIRFEDKLIWAAAATCFFGFFRAGEITVPTETSFDPAVHLAWGDVGVTNNSPSRKIRIFLKRSKTDQFGRGAAVWVGESGDNSCPVKAIVDYAKCRGSTPGPFFKLEGGTPLTKNRFVEKVREAMTRAGIDTSRYSGHSFRIGAATAAAAVGLEDSVIQALGRWSSPAFSWYIRTPREELSQHTQTLARLGRR